MHSKHFKSRYYGEVYLHHNGDWSGMATVSYLYDGEKRVEVSIPCALLLALGKSAAIDKVRTELISVIEDVTLAISEFEEG